MAFGVKLNKIIYRKDDPRQWEGGGEIHEPSLLKFISCLLCCAAILWLVTFVAFIPNPSAPVRPDADRFFGLPAEYLNR